MIHRAATLAVVLLVAAGCARSDRRAMPDAGAGEASPGRVTAPVLTALPTAPVTPVLARGPDPSVPLRLTERARNAVATSVALLMPTVEHMSRVAAEGTAQALATAGTVLPTPRPTATARPSVTPRGGSGSSSGSSAARPTSTRRPTGTPRPSSTPRPTVPTRTPAPTEDRSTLAALRRGGLVIFLRHARTDWSQDPRELEWVKEVLVDRSLFGQCDRQRLLADSGRDDARSIGAAFRDLGIPVGRVRTSPWCRTRETADLAFGGGEVAEDALFDTGYLESGSDERRHYGAALKGLLSEPVDAGANLVLVSHGPQIYDVTGISLDEGHAVVVRPEGGGYKILERRVPPDGWDDLGGG
jgi:phosphohistidine phosphatase SixA